MRLIDADKLKQDLLDKSFYPAIVASAIKNAPTVNQHEWISVEDGLPEDYNERYLIYIPNRYPNYLMTVARYCHSRNSWIGVNDGTYYYDHPTHYMPLPSSPTEKENKNESN